MASHEFYRLVRGWLTVHLPRARRLSPHTIRSYKTALTMLLTYLRETRHLELSQVTFDVIDRATIAGLNKLHPRPPKTPLPRVVANNAPRTPIHQGAHGGSDMASSHPVSSADPSERMGNTSRPFSLRQTASPRSAVDTVISQSSMAGQP